MSSPLYRPVYGELDELPGLVIDRYNDVCVAQIGTADMERLKVEIAAALEKDNPARWLTLEERLAVHAISRVCRNMLRPPFSTAA